MLTTRFAFNAAMVRAALGLVLLGAMALGPRAAGAATAVDTALVLAVDTSGSVSAGRFVLKRQGYAAAFRNPELLSAIRAAGPHQAIAVTMFQWTGYYLQRRVVGWTIVTDAASASALADAIEKGPRQLFGGGTSVSGAIEAAVADFKTEPFEADRHVLDVSGDGANNNGPPAAVARDAAVAQGIVINGLPMLNVEPGLDLWYRSNVIGGEGSFMIAVNDVDAFADAIVKKLIAEIAGRSPDMTATHLAAVP